MSRLDKEVPDNEEASIKVSLLPMKLNIDQVRIMFFVVLRSNLFDSIFRMLCWF